MYHVSEEYRITHRKARYHYNRTRLMGLVPLAVAAALHLFAPPHHAPLLIGAIGCTLGIHLIVWAAYEAHFGGRHLRPTLRLLQNTDRWYPSLLIVCQNGFIAITLVIFWFILCTLGFPAGLFDHVLLGLWMCTWPVLRVLRARQHADPDARSVENAHAFFRLLNIALIAFLIASLVHAMFAQPTTYSNSTDQQDTVLDLFIWLPAILVGVGCIVMFVDHLLRQRPRRARQAKQDAL